MMDTIHICDVDGDVVSVTGSDRKVFLVIKSDFETAVAELEAPSTSSLIEALALALVAAGGNAEEALSSAMRKIKE